MNKPNTLESLVPCSKQYSLKTDLKLNAWLMVATLVWCVNLYLRKKHADWEPPLRAALALAPLVPGLLYIRSCRRFVDGLDELQRRIQLEAWLFAALGTVVVGTAVNVLNSTGVDLPVFRQGLDLEQTCILMLVLWLVGSGIANRRYK